MSRADSAADALDEVIDGVWRQLDATPDLVAVFASRHHARAASMIPGPLARAFEGATIVGCVADSIVGDGEEEERVPALSVTAARLPDVTCRVHLINDPNDLRSLDGRTDDEMCAMMVLVDSFTMNTNTLLERLDQRFPRTAKFGGLASAGTHPGSHLLFAADRALTEGAVVVEFSGDIDVQTIVAQGCRPVGERLAVTASRDNVILEFDRGRPKAVLDELYASLPREDRRHIPSGLHLGVEMAGRDATRGEYLVRPIRGIDPNSGALSVGERIREGAVTQFHLRDAASSSADLRTSLGSFRRKHDKFEPSGALLFSCVERGEQLFGEPDHDTRLFTESFGAVPIGGFFGLGEVGPVGGRTFLHAYTSTFALFRPRSGHE